MDSRRPSIDPSRLIRMDKYVTLFGQIALFGARRSTSGTMSFMPPNADFFDLITVGQHVLTVSSPTQDAPSPRSR